jgi:hypothetical protein
MNVLLARWGFCLSLKPERDPPGKMLEQVEQSVPFRGTNQPVGAHPVGFSSKPRLEREPQSRDLRCPLDFTSKDVRSSWFRPYTTFRTQNDPDLVRTVIPGTSIRSLIFANSRESDTIFPLNYVP